MSLPHLVFLVNRHNTNSIAALAGVIETTPDLADLEVDFLWENAHVSDRLLRLANEDRQPVCLILSFVTAHRLRVRALLQELSFEASVRQKITIVAGGAHPSGDPEDTLRLGVDVVACGEGEQVFTDLLLRLREGAPILEIPGTVIRWDGAVRYGPKARLVNLEQYPPFSVKYERFAPLEITRGCPFGCQFCQTPFLLGGKVRHRSVASLSEHVTQAMRHGYSYLRFITPNALSYGSPDGRSVNLGAVEELLTAMNRLMPRDRIYFGSFPSEVRPESISPEAITLIRRYAANDNLVFGAQTGSPRLLASLRRGHTVEDIYRAAEITVAGGLRPIIDFVFGLPEETEDDVEMTMKVISDLAEMGGIIHSHSFMPLPGTPLATAPPGRISSKFHALLDRLASQGKHFGQWRRQEELSQNNC